MLFKKKKRKETKADFDFLPLFFWDKGLSDTAKIFMCLAGGGKVYREKTLEKLTALFPPEMIEDLRLAIEELEFYGYITNETYKGEYKEQRIDRRLCICPNNRLPKIVPPSGGLPGFSQKAVEMFEDAMRLGFVAETGKDTTYLLYDALRIFTAVENVLYPFERVILPQIGTESIRQDTAAASLRAYPHAVVAIIVTTQRVIFVQEDSEAEGRQAGMARLMTKDFGSVDAVCMDEACGRITFKVLEPCGLHEFTKISLDLMTAFALENYKTYYSAMLSLVEKKPPLPPLSYEREAELF